MGETDVERPPPRRPWRDNLCSLGLAIGFVVLLKPMLVELYQIPTPSMQPTLMGSPEAGVHDRIFVDKVRYALWEPQRWDVAVFRYPLRQNQSYIKRIVGVGGDRLRIVGGNFYRADEAGEIVGVLRKPDRVQRGLWREIYPARRVMAGVSQVLDRYFEGTAGSWREQDEALVATPSASGRVGLTFTEPCSDRIDDGYPPAVARAIGEASAGLTRLEGVQDVRFGLLLTPQRSPDSCVLEIGLRPAGSEPHEYRAEIAAGKVVLRGIGGKESCTSETFDCPLPAGRATELRFAHVDDRLLLWRDGTLLAALEIGGLRLEQVLDASAVRIGLRVSGGGEQRVERLVVERDLHYLPTGLPTGSRHVIRVPDDHFFMAGDNTQASADSRLWELVELGVTPDGRVVDPRRTDVDQVRRLHGNARPWSLEAHPDVDENPVVVRATAPGEPDRLAFTDAYGEVHALHGWIGDGYRPGSMRFVDEDSANVWSPRRDRVPFVPREHVLGRAVLGVWPLWPFRPGFVR